MVIKKRKEPRFSVNKLGEYLTAKPSRRKKIIEEQKYPAPFRTAGYKDARKAITDYIINDCDEKIITSAISKIRKSVTLKDNEIKNSVNALKGILATDLPDLSKFKKKRYRGSKEYLNIEGLDISVYPDIILRKGNKVGCINIHIIKTEQYRLTKDGSKYVTTVQHQFAESYITKEGEEVEPKFCISIDCFGNSHEIGTKSYKRRLDNIHDACEEIVLRWDSV